MKVTVCDSCGMQLDEESRVYQYGFTFEIDRSKQHTCIDVDLCSRCLPNGVLHFSSEHLKKHLIKYILIMGTSAGKHAERRNELVERARNEAGD